LAVELREQYLREADMTDEGCCFRLRLAEFVTNYSRLLILSHGLQQSFENGSPPDPAILTNALKTATVAINAFVDKIAATGFWRYSPDCYIIYAGYCATFLLKLIDTKFPYQFEEDQKERIISLVSGLVDTLASPEIVIDERHTPKLYAGFLAGLLKRIGKEVRDKKRLKLDHDHRKETVAKSPPPLREVTMKAERSSTSPIPGTPGSGHASEANTDVHGNYSNGQNPLAVFPTANTVDNHQTFPQFDSLSLTVGQNAPFPTSATNWSPHTNDNMTWEDVYAAPDTQIHPNSSLTHLAPNEFGHQMHIGSQWNFNADPTSPLARWGMEELVPSVHHLIPSGQQLFR